MANEYTDGEILVHVPNKGIDQVEEFAEDMDCELKSEWGYGNSIYLLSIPGEEWEACRKVYRHLDEGWARRLGLDEEERLSLLSDSQSKIHDLKGNAEDIDAPELMEKVEGMVEYLNELEERLIEEEWKAQRSKIHEQRQR